VEKFDLLSSKTKECNPIKNTVSVHTDWPSLPQGVLSFGRELLRPEFFGKRIKPKASRRVCERWNG